MVLNNHSYEEQTRRLLAETQTELTAIGNQMAELQQKWNTLKKETEAYEVALQGYLRRIGKQTGVEFDWTKFLSEAKTHRERLQLIAKHNDGKIRVNQATDILFTKDFTKTKKRATAYTMIQGMLATMAEEGIFEKVKAGSGEYRLIGSQQSLLR